MITYPKIYYFSNKILNKNIIAFNKLDGSNIRCEWTLKHSKNNKNYGINKFGTRKMIIDEKFPIFSDAVKMIKEKSEILDRIFRTNKYFRNINKLTLFFEYYSENSFAGQHKTEDKKNIKLFDVFIENRNFITPDNFIKIFNNEIDIPKIVYRGIINKTFINDIKNNVYNIKESVVCK